jgi:hypothetical protein
VSGETSNIYKKVALKLAGKSIDEERDWQTKQLQQLPSEIVDLVMNDSSQVKSAD